MGSTSDLVAPRPTLILATHEYLPFRGGAATYVHETAIAAGGIGIPVQVWAPSRGPTCGDRVSTNSRVIYFRSSGRLTPLGLGQLAYGWWQHLRRPENRERPIVLMSVGAQIIFFFFDFLGLVSPRRTFVVFYGSEVLRFSEGVLWKWLAKRYYERAGGFGACSKYTAQLAEVSGLLPPEARVIAAPCALPSAYRAGDPEMRTDSNDDVFRILTVARLHPRKGQLEVALALAALAEELRGKLVYQIVGVGDAEYRAGIEAACAAGGVHCEFLGALEDSALPAVYRGCTLYVQASQTLPRSVEGFGISFLEAGFYGKASVAFRSGGIGEAILHGRTGILVPEGDVAGLSAAIAALLRDSGRREAMGLAAREHVGGLRWEDTARAIFQPAQSL